MLHLSLCFYVWICVAGVRHGYRGSNNWCGRGDLNPHALRRHPLKMVCLPIPPLPLGMLFAAGLDLEAAALVIHAETVPFQVARAMLCATLVLETSSNEVRLWLDVCAVLLHSFSLFRRSLSPLALRLRSWFRRTVAGHSWWKADPT